jgi:hypothetical protein
MILSIVTGGGRDYIRITTETLRDANQIVGVFASKFVNEHKDWFHGPFPVGPDKIAFDIYLVSASSQVPADLTLKKIEELAMRTCNSESDLAITLESIRHIFYDRNKAQ